jgi:hypothetical protein
MEGVEGMLSRMKLSEAERVGVRASRKEKIAARVTEP